VAAARRTVYSAWPLRITAASAPRRSSTTRPRQRMPFPQNSADEPSGLKNQASGIAARRRRSRSVPAERSGPVAQPPDEGPQVLVGGEVARRHRGHEDVVLRAVRVQDLGHGSAYPAALLGVRR
jgi:hypothetical protein